MTITKHLDWIEATYPSSTSILQCMPGWAAFDDWEACDKAFFGYQCMQKPAGVEGIYYMYSPGRDDRHLQITGSALAELRETRPNESELLQHILKMGGHFTRIDCAINLHNEQLTPVDLKDAYEDDAIITPARSGTWLQGLKKSGATFYLGSRSSERFFRAYDKRAETKTAGDPWLRLELVLRGKRAQIGGIVLANSNIYAAISSAIVEFVDFRDNPVYRAAVEAVKVFFPEVPRKMPSTLDWLLGVVAKSAANFQIKNVVFDIPLLFSSEYDRYLYLLGAPVSDRSLRFSRIGAT